MYYMYEFCVDVSSHLPWTKEDPVYTRGGMPIMEKLAALLGDHREVYDQ